MALSAKFLADFETFYTACQKAEVSLTSFQSNASKVEGALKRMQDSFTGTKLIQDAQLMSTAYERLAKEGIGLTSAELQRMGTTASAAIEKMRAIGMDVPAGIQKIATEAEKARTVTGSWLTDFGSQIKATALGFVSAQAIIGTVQTGFRLLTAFVADSVTAYAEAEVAAKKMTTALQQQGTATPETIKAFNDLATQFQNTTRYSDDLINEMEALLTQVGQVAPAQMKAALAASTNLAAGLGIDLRDATMLVAKAFSGGADQIGRLKQILGDTYRPGLDMAGVLDLINSKFGGQAAAAAETYAGRIDQIKNAWNNAQEAAGGLIAQDPLLIASLRGVKTAADDAASGGSGIVSEFGLLGATMPEWIKSLKRLHDDLAETADAANALADGVARMNAMPPPKQFIGGGDLKSQFAEWDRAHAEFADNVVKGWNKDEAAAKKYADAVEAAFRKWGGADLAEQVKVLDVTFRRLADSGAITRQQLDDIAAEAASLAAAGAVLTPRLQAIVDAESGIARAAALARDGQADLDAAFKRSTTELDRLNVSVGKYIANLPQAIFQAQKFSGAALLPDVTPAIEAAAARAKAIADETYNDIEGRMRASGVVTRADLARTAADLREKYDSMKASGLYSIDQLDAAWKRYEAAADAAIGKTKAVGDSLGALAQAFATLAQVSDGSFGGLVKALGTVIAAMSLGSKAAKDFKSTLGDATMGTSEKVLQLTTDVVGMVAAFAQATSEGGKAQRALGGAMAGAQIGMSLGGPWGAAIGAGVGALTGWIRGMNAGRSAVEEFAASMGGFDALQQKMVSTLGTDYDRLWKALTQLNKNSSTQEAQAAIDAITAALDRAKSAADSATAAAAADATATAAAQQAELDAITERYATTIDALQSEYDSLNKSVSAEAEEAVMGLVETQERERMKQITAEKAAQEAMRDAEIAAKKSTFEEILAQGTDIDDKLRKYYADNPLEIPYYFKAQNEPTTPDGGGRYAPSPTPGRQGTVAPVVIKLNERELGRGFLRITPTMLAEAGR